MCIDATSKRYGYAGIQQLVLDVQFIMKLCGVFVNDETSDFANDVCESALRGYFAQHKDNPETLQVI